MITRTALRQALESKLDKGTILPHEKVALAVLYIEDEDDEKRGLAMLDDIIISNPSTLRARIFRAYYHIHIGISDEELRKAVDVLNIDTQNVECRASKLVLMPFILEELGGSYEGSIALLDEAVRLKPEWVTTHWYLASRYERMGRIIDAIHELETAKSYIVKNESAVDPLDYDFERMITGRIGGAMGGRLIDENIIRLRTKLTMDK